MTTSTPTIEQEMFPAEKNLQLPAPSVEPTPPTEEKPVEFMPFCGIRGVFDPSPKSECVTICKQDCLQDFNECLKHHEAKPTITIKKRSTTPRTPKESKPKADVRVSASGVRFKNGGTFWGHVPNTRCGLVDDCLVKADRPMFLDEIAEYADNSLERSLLHMKNIQKDIMDVVAPDDGIYFDKDGYIHFSGNKTAADQSEGVLTLITAYRMNDFYKKVATRRN